MVIFYLLYHFKLVFLKSCESLSIFINIFFSSTDWKTLPSYMILSKTSETSVLTLSKQAHNALLRCKRKSKSYKMKLRFYEQQLQLKIGDVTLSFIFYSIFLVKQTPLVSKLLSIFFYLIINPLSARIFTVLDSSLEDRVLHKEAWVAKLLGTHLSIQVHKKVKFSWRDNSPLALKPDPHCAIKTIAKAITDVTQC